MNSSRIQLHPLIQMGVHYACAKAVTHWHDQHGLFVRPQTLTSDNCLCVALKLPWLTITRRGTRWSPRWASKLRALRPYTAPAATNWQGKHRNCHRFAQRYSFLPNHSGLPWQPTRFFARALAAIDSPVVASARSSTSTGTSPAYMAPKYASVLAGLKPQLISTRSPACRPADRKPAAKRQSDRELPYQEGFAQSPRQSDENSLPVAGASDPRSSNH